VTTLLILALALAICLARRGRSLGGPWRLAGWTAVAVIVGLAVVMAPPVVVLRKVVGFLVMPATLVWVAIAALVVQSWHDPRRRWPLLALLAAYSAAGSPWTAYALVWSLERPFQDVHPLTGSARYDAVLVMGGGSSSLPHSHADDVQLSGSGDRIRLAAALFDRGSTPILVTSGSSLDRERDISLETSTLWRGMGIPADAIVRLAGPRNSVEEVKAYARLVEERGWQRPAIVTSARHLPRVLALCRRHGLAAEPLPSDFRADRPPLDLTTIVPNGQGFAEVEDAAWEYAGRLAVHLVGG
jgi:uncharacterized SAM-binding protein YcdF (DUF218 family)